MCTTNQQNDSVAQTQLCGTSSVCSPHWPSNWCRAWARHRAQVVRSRRAARSTSGQNVVDQRIGHQRRRSARPRGGRSRQTARDLRSGRSSYGTPARGRSSGIIATCGCSGVPPGTRSARDLDRVAVDHQIDGHGAVLPGQTPQGEVLQPHARDETIAAGARPGRSSRLAGCADQADVAIGRGPAPGSPQQFSAGPAGDSSASGRPQKIVVVLGPQADVRRTSPADLLQRRLDQRRAGLRAARASGGIRVPGSRYRAAVMQFDHRGRSRAAVRHAELADAGPRTLAAMLPGPESPRR